MFKPYEKIYVQLEDFTGLIPTQGKHVSDDVFELQESEDFPSDDDVWLFLPGSLVRCARVNKSNASEYQMAEDGLEEGEEILVAYEKVEG